jgi:DNA-binding transcriptional ArsR family regulator
MTTNEPDVTEAVEARDERELDLVALKALAHPLRVQIFDVLSTYGSFTASGLAERFSESSGAMSYHLRQLEKHGFVREVEGKGTGRERWWERIPGSIRIGNEDLTDTPAGKSATNLVARQFRMASERMLADFAERSQDELTREWRDAAGISTMNTRMTVEQLDEFVREVNDLAIRMVRETRGKNEPGSRPVHITLNAFPVIDGEITPREHTGEKE